MSNSIKRCSRCKFYKPLSVFHRDKYRPDGLTVDCKRCRLSASAKRIYPRKQTGTKVCTSCGKTKSVSAFSTHRRSRDGLHPWCKACRRLKEQDRRNPRQTTGTKVCTKCKKEKACNEFYKNGNAGDGLTCECKVCSRTRQREYLKTPNGKANDKASNERRRARKKSLPTTLTTEQWKAQLEHYDYKCAYKDKNCNGSITMDHIYPLSRFPYGTTMTNCVPCCSYHNLSKGDKTPLEAELVLIKSPLSD